MNARFPVARALATVLLLPLAGCGRSARDAVQAFDPDSIPEAYRYSTAALMWPGAARAFQITPGGDLYNGEWTVRVRPSASGAPADSPRVIAFEQRWRPVAHWRRRSGPVRWDFEAAALPEPGLPGSRAAVSGSPRDSGLIVALEARATNLGGSPCEARLELSFERPDSVPVFLAFDAPDPPPSEHRWAAPTSDRRVQGWSDAPVSGPSARAAWTLEPGRSRTQRFVLPVYATPGRALARWARVSHAARMDQARSYWEVETGRGTRFELGDGAVEGALRAALAILLSCRERRGARWVSIANPYHYRDVWLRDGARAIAALSMAGRTTEARELAEGLAQFQWPQGAFLSQRGQLDGTGQALWAFEQALLRPATDPATSRFADRALAAWRWCERQRRLGREAGWRFGAMLPFAQPRDNELVLAQLVGNDAWAIAGYRSAARLLAAAGREAEAESVEASRARYREDFVAALERCGSRDIPPSWQGVGHDWGNLQVAYPCAALSVTDPRCAAVARRVWKAAGGAGLGYYGVRDSLHYYVGADLGTWALLAGMRAATDSVLDAMLAWRSASGGAGELFVGSSRGWGRNPPPHATSAAALVTLVRNALVFDDGDTLRLTLGARARWWRNARVLRAPTRWGTLDLEFGRRGEEAVWRWTPVPVWTALTLPPGTRLARLPAAPLEPGRAGEVVLAPPGSRRAIVTLADAPGGAR